MDYLIQNGIDWIVAIQSLGGWLELPMKFFTFLGTENFFLLIVPALYWSIDSALGLRVGIILFLSAGANEVFKMVFAGPRPYWVSTQVKPFSAETSFGIPSAHAQNTAAVWGIVAAYVRKMWLWVAAILLIFFIGFSRLYLGVHFVQDVVIGWLIGGVILWTLSRYWNPVSAWVKTKTFATQVFVAFAISLVIVLAGALVVAWRADFVIPAEWIENARRAGPEPDPVSMRGIITTAGSFFGLSFGIVWMAARGGFHADGPLVTRALRYVIGLIGVAILYAGLGLLFPRGEALIPYVLRYIRYAMVGFWVTGGAPWLFFHFKLANRPKM